MSQHFQWASVHEWDSEDPETVQMFHHKEAFHKVLTSVTDENLQMWSLSGAEDFWICSEAIRS